RLCAAEKSQAVAGAADNTRFSEGCHINRLGRGDLFRLDSFLDVVEVDFRIALGGEIVETALGHTAQETHLAPFEALDRHAGAGFLAFNTATASLAFGRTNAATHEDAGVAGAGVVSELIEFHVLCSLFLKRRLRQQRGA